MKPPGGGNLDYVKISVVLAFLPHIIPKNKNQILPVLESDGLTWEEADLSPQVSTVQAVCFNRG